MNSRNKRFITEFGTLLFVALVIYLIYRLVSVIFATSDTDPQQVFENKEELLSENILEPPLSAISSDPINAPSLDSLKNEQNIISKKISKPGTNEIPVDQKFSETMVEEKKNLTDTSDQNDFSIEKTDLASPADQDIQRPQVTQQDKPVVLQTTKEPTLQLNQDVGSSQDALQEEPLIDDKTDSIAQTIPCNIGSEFQNEKIISKKDLNFLENVYLFNDPLLIIKPLKDILENITSACEGAFPKNFIVKNIANEELMNLSFLQDKLSSKAVINSEDFSAIANFKNGELHGKFTLKDIKENPLLEISIKDGKKDNIETLYFKGTSKISKVTDYFDGKKNGLEQKYNIHGKLQMETSYVADIKHGDETTYDRSGNILSMTIYDNGKAIASSRFKNNTLVEVIEY